MVVEWSHRDAFPHEPTDNLTIGLTETMLSTEFNAYAREQN